MCNHPITWTVLLLDGIEKKSLEVMFCSLILLGHLWANMSTISSSGISKIIDYNNWKKKKISLAPNFLAILKFFLRNNIFEISLVRSNYEFNPFSMAIIAMEALMKSEVQLDNLITQYKFTNYLLFLFWVIWLFSLHWLI